MTLGYRFALGGRISELMLVAIHLDARAVKGHAFGFQPEALFEAAFAGQRDFASGADHAMPRQSGGRGAQCPDHLSRPPGITGGTGDVAISGDFPFGDAPYGVAQDFEHVC